MRPPWILLMLGASGPILAAEPVRLDEKLGTEEPPVVDPDVLRALEQMGESLRDQRKFLVRSESTTDQVLDSGQKVQTLQTAELRLERPDKMRLEVDSDRKTREFYYDGESLTVYGPRNQYYATIDAPPTLRELAKSASEQYGLDLPLADLFLWGTAENPAEALEAAMYVGPATVNGQKTDQYAMRQPGMDWQVWLLRGPERLPVRMVITTTDLPQQPQHEVDLEWTVDRDFNDNIFTFQPPAGAQRIELVPLEPKKSASRAGGSR